MNAGQTRIVTNVLFWGIPIVGSVCNRMIEISMTKTGVEL